VPFPPEPAVGKSWRIGGRPTAGSDGKGKSRVLSTGTSGFHQDHQPEDPTMGRHSEHTPEQRTEIVLALLRREEPASVLARRHKVSEQTLYRWRDDFLAGGKASLASGKAAKRQEEARLRDLEKELAERDRVIGELTIANRFLKKTTDPNSTWYTGRKS